MADAYREAIGGSLKLKSGVKDGGIKKLVVVTSPHLLYLCAFYTHQQRFTLIFVVGRRKRRS